tara:strand:+ start:1471 stop:1662 length:192 start_codon:yes stop_codon:yes gene_type:complete
MIMATGRMSKQTKSLQDLHRFLDKKSQEVENEREEDRSWTTKEHLINLKKQKLKVKEQLKGIK